MRRRFWEILAIVTMVIIIAYLSYKLVADEGEVEVYKVAVVVQDSQNDRWTAMKEGMEQAAKKYSMKLQFSTTSPYCASNDLWSAACFEKENGAQGLVISPLGQPEDERVLSLAETPLVLMASDMAIENSYSCVTADDTEIGRTIGEAIYEDYGKTITTLKIGVVSGPVTQTSMQERLNGLTESLEAHGVQIEWTMGLGASLQRALIREMSSDNYNTDIIVALGNQETEIVTDCLINTGVETAVYGEGYSQKAVHYLDNGRISCLVLSNDFVMGYKSIELLAKKMGLNDSVDGNQELGIWCVHQYDMYSEENVKVLFPIAQ